MILYPNAKINIGLFVTEKRTDGFHNIESIFYPIPLQDSLEIKEREGKTKDFYFKNTGINIDCNPENNLVIKAFKLIAQDYKLPFIEMTLNKVIPFGAGLGGGSADAAFMLKILNENFNLNITEERLLEYAASLGSDCAFFIKNKPVYASGRGEILGEINLSLKGYKIVLVKPNFSVSTPEAYKGICPQPSNLDLRMLSKFPITDWKNIIRNDFEKSLFIKYPRIREIKEQMYNMGALYASMSGSGSAVYGIFEEEKNINESFNAQEFVWKGELE